MGNLLQSPQKDPAIYTMSPLLTKASTEQPNHALLLQAKELLLKLERCIESLEGYTPRASEIRESLSKPKDDELQKQAFNAIVKNVKIIESFYDLIESEVKQFILKIVTALAGEHIMTKQSILTYKLLHLMQQIYRIDDVKMRTPDLQVRAWWKVERSANEKHFGGCIRGA